MSSHDGTERGVAHGAIVYLAGEIHSDWREEIVTESETRSLDNDCPDPRGVEPPEMGDVVALAQVGGLHHRYTRRLTA